MNDLNKITNTRIGDNIHYYVNGKEDRGVVVKMNNAYVSVLKGNGSIDEIHINDTFFIKDILTNKTWNGMTLEERTVELQKAHAFSPRFLTKTWEDLPRELKDVLQKTNIEESTHGQIGGNRAGVSTATDVKTPEDYKGESTEDKKEEFKHEKEKPTVDKNNGMEEDHKKKDQFDGMKEDWRPTGGESDKQKNFVNKQYGKPLYGVTTLDKEGDGAGNSGVNSLETTGVYNARYSDDKGRYRDQEKDTEEKGEEKDDGRRSRD
jgi:hypothetical protein